MVDTASENLYYIELIHRPMLGQIPVKKMIIITVVPAFLAGCYSAPLTMNQLDGLRKGLTPEQTHHLTKQSPKSYLKITYKGQAYLIQDYSVEGTGTITSQPRISTQCDKYGCHVMPIIPSQSAHYLMIYKQMINKKCTAYQLYAWGLKRRLIKSSDQTIQYAIQSALAIKKKG